MAGEQARSELHDECEMVRVEIGGGIDRLEGRVDGLQGQIGGLAGRMNGLQGQIHELTTEVHAGNREFFARLITAYSLMSVALAALILAVVSLPR